MSARALIAAAVKAALETARPGFRFQEDANAPFDPPSDDSWANIYFVDGSAEFASFGGEGGNLERGPVVVYVNIFTPIGGGDGEAVELTEVVKNALRRLKVGTHRFDRFMASAEGNLDGEYRKQTAAVFTRSERV